MNSLKTSEQYFPPHLFFRELIQKIERERGVAEVAGAYHRIAQIEDPEWVAASFKKGMGDLKILLPQLDRNKARPPDPIAEYMIGNGLEIIFNNADDEGIYCDLFYLEGTYFSTTFRNLSFEVIDNNGNHVAQFRVEYGEDGREHTFVIPNKLIYRKKGGPFYLRFFSSSSF